MKIFVSWSGAPSQKAAKLLKGWLEDVMQNVEVWLSSDDIASGELWVTALKDALGGPARSDARACR